MLARRGKQVRTMVEQLLGRTLMQSVTNLSTGNILLALVVVFGILPLAGALIIGALRNRLAGG
jgi:hypothetical protein